MADRKTDGAPKAPSAKARASSPSKTKPASPVLPVKAEEKEPAKPAAPAKVPAKKAAKPSVAPATVRAEQPAMPVAPVAKAPAPAAIVPPAQGPIETPAVVASAAAATEEAVTKIQDTVKEGIEVMDMKTTQTVDATKNAADQAQAMFGDLNERAKGVMERNAKIVQEVTDLTKGNVEAIVASSRAAAKGVESLSREAAEYGRKSFEEASTALKSFAEVRSPADLFRLQSDYARSYFDSVVAETSKMSEAFVKLAGEVAEPITNRYSVAAERVRTIAL